MLIRDIEMHTNTEVSSLNCRVVSVRALSKATFEVELESTAGTPLSYQAGQYLQLQLDVNQDGQVHALSYSIANAPDPNKPNQLQLFIQNNGEFSTQILERLKEKVANRHTIEIRLPLGKAFLQSDLSLHHVFVAAGSGISKIKCLTEEILKREPEAKVSIYWSNRNTEDFYLLNTFKHWQSLYKNLSFTPTLESEHSNWQGRSGYIYKVVKEDFNDLTGAQLYLCGSPKMVYGTIDNLKCRGVNEENCYSDVFEFAPRNQRIAV